METTKNRQTELRWVLRLSAILAVVVATATMEGCTADKAVAPAKTATIDESRATYALTVQEIMNNNCAFPGCHAANSAQAGVILDTYEATKRSVETKKVICAMEWKGGCINMPAAAPVPDSLLQYMIAWKAKGYPQ